MLRSMHHSAITGTSPAATASTSAKLLTRTLKVGELARRTGKTVRAIHLYEELGLLTPAIRSGWTWQPGGSPAE